MFCVQANNTASGVKTPLVLSPLAARATLRRNNLLPSPPHQQALPFLDANPGRVSAGRNFTEQRNHSISLIGLL